MTSPAYRVDGVPVDAAAFYAAACDPRRSAIVEACAGAGKTWMLVSRILRALVDGAEPEQILAITFTRKAAGEMRERLDDWLRSLSDVSATPELRAQALVERGVPAAQARALAARLGELHQQVLQRARGVEIRTFHGWFAQLLAQAPLESLQALGLASAPALIEDTGPLQDDLWRDFHRAVQADPGLRADYTELTRRHRRHALQRWLEVAWQRRSEIESAQQAGTLVAGVAPAHEVYADCVDGIHPLQAMLEPTWRAELQALARELQARAKVRSSEAAERLVDALASDSPAVAFDRAWQAVFTAKDEPRKQIGGGVALAAVCARLQALRERARQQDGHDDHRRMARLSLTLLRAYAQLKQARALVDMGDLESLALAVLVDGEVAGWMHSRLGQRLRHLLIDEFQDTSPLQWQALHGWLSGYGGAGGGQGLSLFIVGDPKQSIYRFRRAEPRVFLAAREFVAQALQGRRLECDHTRRNAPAIVQAINAVFGKVAAQGDWDGFRDHSTASSADGQVRQLPVAMAPATAAGGPGGSEAPWRDSLLQPRRTARELRLQPEARQLAQAIAALIAQGEAAGEIMVLARRRSTLAVVAQALAERGLPFTVPEALNLTESAEAQDLLAVLDVLVSPDHDLSLARALRSPLFGVDDDDLLQLARRAAVDALPWWSALQTLPAASPALQRARTLLAGWADAAATLPTHDLFERIVHEGELRARLAAAVPAPRRRQAQQAIDAMLAAALEVDGGRYLTPYRFIRTMRRQDLGSRLSAPADAVRLLTVHGAKGLEARWVLIADSDPQPRRADGPTLLVDWPVGAGAPQRLAFVARASELAPTLAALWQVEERERGREELNGLYVAMTRAEIGLVFSATSPRNADPGSWWIRVAGLAAEWRPAGVAKAPMAASVPASVPVLPRLRRPAATLEAPAAATVDAGRAQLGQAVHRLLEWIGRPGADFPRERWPQAARAAAAWAGAGVDAEQVHAMAARVLDSPECARFFGGPALRWAGNELPIAAAGRVLRIDRLVRLEPAGRPEWWVLDFKLAAQPQDWAEPRAQLAAYREAVALALPGAAVGAAFITGDGRLIVVDEAAAAGQAGVM